MTEPLFLVTTWPQIKAFSNLLAMFSLVFRTEAFDAFLLFTIVHHLKKQCVFIMPDIHFLSLLLERGILSRTK